MMADPSAAMTSSYFARRTPLVPVSSADIYAQPYPGYFQLPSWFRAYQLAQQQQTYLTDESSRRLQEEYERQRFMGAQPVPGGTILHKGFYDLLALSTPVVQTVSRFWNGVAGAREDPLVVGAPYEQLPVGPPPRVVDGPLPPTSPNATPRKTRRVSKDMIGPPKGFMYVSSLFP